LPDPFLDSYRGEAVECGDIIDLIGKSSTEYVTVIIKKDFLKHIVHSHLLYLRKIETT